MSALEAAARSCSVPFRRVMRGEELRALLAGGEPEPGLEPHLGVLLAEVPREMLLRAMAEVWAPGERARGYAVLRELAGRVGEGERVSRWSRG